MVRHRSTHLGQRTGRRHRSHHLSLALAALLALLVLCGLCAVAAPANAAASPAAPVFTPFAARVTGPGIEISVSPVTGQCTNATPIFASWTTSPAAPAGGEFLVCLEAVVPQPPAPHYGEKLVAAGGGSSYNTWLLADTGFGGQFRVYVAWRPTAGSGAWVSSATSSGDPLLVRSALNTFTGEHDQPAEPGATSHVQGASVTVRWVSTLVAWGDQYGLGEFCVCLRSADGQLYAAKTMPGSDAWYGAGAPGAVVFAYRMPLSLDVPAGKDYQVMVGWRPTIGTGFFGAWATSVYTYNVTSIGITVAVPKGTASYLQGGSLPVSWTTGSAVAAGGDFFVCVRSAAGVFYAPTTVAATGVDTYSTTVKLDNVPLAGDYTAIVGWRPAAGVGLPLSWGSSTGTFAVTAGPTADLTALALSGPPANYVFAPATYTYAGITVPNTVESVTVTPTGAGVITVNGAVVTSKQASKAITLKKPGSVTEITVEATEPDKTAKTYTLKVTRNKEAPATPTFSPEPGAVAAGAKVTISSEGADQIYYTTDGKAPTRKSLPYVGGEPVRVSPSTTGSVTLKALAVKRGHDDSAVGTAVYTLAATSDLSGLDLSGHPANYSFARSTYVYQGVTVANKVKTVNVTPTGAGVLTVNGTKVSSGKESGAVTLAAGSPTTITVEAKQDGKSVKTYALAVTRQPDPALSSAKEITAFSFAPWITGVIDQDKGTIAIAVLPESYVGAVIARFTTTGASVHVGKATQTSGETANDFTNPVTYTVTAANGSTRDYVVTVSKNATLPAPTFSPAGGVVKSGTPITISCPGADIIAYTTDGTTPSIDTAVNAAANGQKYVAPIPFSWRTVNASTGTMTVTAVAGKLGYGVSAVATVTYTLAPFTITASAGAGGTISPDGAQSVKWKESQTFTIKPSEGYHIADVLVDGASVGAVTSYRFPSVDKDHKIAASFAGDVHPLDYTITPSVGAGGGGTISPASAQTVRYGGSVRFDITPSRGYFVRDVLVDGISQGSISIYTFPNVTKDSTIVASFARSTFTITPSAGLGGTITPPTAQTVINGGSQLFTIAPNQGYRVADVLVDGISVGAVTSHLFTNVSKDSTIAASFARNSFTITPSAGQGGTISPASAQTVNSGGSVQFTIAPNQGYRVADVLVDGISVGAVTSWPFTNVTTNHTIAASFARNSFTITPSAGQGGTISPGTAQTVQPGGSLEFTIIPDQGYHVADVLVDGISVGAVTSHQFQNVSKDSTIAASFARNSFTITPIAGPGGTILPATPQIVSYGGSQQFTIIPNQGYRVAGVLVDGVSVGAVTSYPFTNVTKDSMIAAAFAADAQPAIGAFSFQGLTPAVPGIIDEGNHLISVTVPFGTDVSSLVPAIVFTGDSVNPAGGVSCDFRVPVHYVVSSGATSVDYTVTVTVSSELAVGDNGFGGTVAYILAPGDPGYSQAVQHGLAVAAGDQSTGIAWALPAYQSQSVPGALATAIGSGSANTDAIVAQNGAGTGYAAGLARAYAGGGFADWYLPSKDELNKLYVNRASIGMSPNGWYWSSSESSNYADGTVAWGQAFATGTQQEGLKSDPLCSVRAMRAF